MARTIAHEVEFKHNEPLHHITNCACKMK